MTLVEQVEDSEGEECLFHPKALLWPQKTSSPPQSDPPTRTATMAKRAVASTSRGETHAEPAVTTKKPRPKPQRRNPTGLIDPVPFAPPSNSSSTPTPAPKNLSTTVPLEPVLPADSIPQGIQLTIAERAKSRLRTAKPKPVVEDIIDIPSDDEDERLLQLSPLRLEKKKKGVLGAMARPVPDLPPSSMPASQDSLPIPTSDLHPGPPDDVEEPPLKPPKKRKRQRVVADDEEEPSVYRKTPITTSAPSSSRLNAVGIEESPLKPPKKRKPKRVFANEKEEEPPSAPKETPAPTPGPSSSRLDTGVTEESPSKPSKKRKPKRVAMDDEDEEELSPASRKSPAPPSTSSSSRLDTGGVEESPLNPSKKQKLQRVAIDDDDDHELPPASKKTPTPTSASSFTRLNYGHSLANEEKPMTMTEIIRKANSAAGTPSGIKSYSSFMKGSRTALRKIAPLHARRKTPPPLPPKPPPPKKTKKQLDLEEKWEEELEETIEGWAALSSQERELLRKQKRDMEMGYED